MTESAILRRGRGWVVAYKPAGLLVDGDPAREPDSLRARLAAELGATFRDCHPHTRLDRPVAGLTLWSLEPHTRRAFVEATKNGTMRKLYLALSHRPVATGVLRETAGAARWRTRAGRPFAEPPRTRVVRLATSGPTTLVAAGITAGKWHQIRLHLAGAGTPVIGDRLHGGAPRVVRPDGAVLAAPATALECVGVELPERSRRRLVLEPPRGFVADGAAWAGLASAELGPVALLQAWRAVWGEIDPRELED
jgi:23S rRNA-/tRNA-specific pseudouridylate synthase